MEEEEKEFDVDAGDFLEVAIDNVSVSNLGFLVFLRREGDERSLPIFIGAGEAHAIAMAYKDQTPPRPLTHDLLKNILGFLDCEVTKVMITGISENTFYGRVYLRREGFEDFDVDSRPSDAIALALRYRAPIFVHKDVYAAAAVVMKDDGDGSSPSEKKASPGPIAFENAIAPVSETQAPTRPQAPQNPMETLRETLQAAILEERYEEAAKIRDQLKQLESKN